jgi:hypothetical protein
MTPAGDIPVKVDSACSDAPIGPIGSIIWPRSPMKSVN